MSHQRLLGEYMEIDHTRLQDEAYRREVGEALVHAYQHRIWGYCVTRLGEVDGEDVAAQVFATAWDRLASFQPQAAIASWLLGIARNKCAQALRNRTRRAAIVRGFQADIRAQVHREAQELPDCVAGDRAPLARLADSLPKLRDDERLCLALRYTKDLPVAEIAALVGKSETAVRKRLYRALQRLKELIEDDLEG